MHIAYRAVRVGDLQVVELVAAALQLGFDSAVVNLPPAGGLLQPVWHHGAVPLGPRHARIPLFGARIQWKIHEKT